MDSRDPKRYEWLLSFPMDDLPENTSDQNQNSDNRADSSQMAQNALDGVESGEGASSSSARLGEGSSGVTAGGAQAGCDGGCAM